jgi:hypothetical protein
MPKMILSQLRTPVPRFGEVSGEVTEGKALTHLENTEKILGFLRGLCELISVLQYGEFSFF